MSRPDLLNLALFFCFGLCAAGQQVTVPRPPPEGLIHLDVVVTNQSGHPVPELESSDLTLLDNGQPQKIVSLDGLSRAVGEPHVPTVVILLLDSLDAPNLSKYERREVAQFLREDNGHLSHPVAIFALEDSGFWFVAQPSLDGNALATTLDHGTKLALLRGPPGSFRTNGEVPSTPDSLDPTFSLIPYLTALRTVAWIAAAERQKPERKLLLWIGPGVGLGSGAYPDRKYLVAGTSSLPMDLACPLGKQKIDSVAYVYNCPEAQQSIFAKANWFSTLLRESRITLYTFAIGEDDPGLIRQPGYEIEGASTHLLSPQMRDRWKQFLSGAPSAEQASPMDLYKNVLAVQSGGQVLAADTDLAKQITDSVREASAFYTLTFDPPPAAHSDELHTLQINLNQLGIASHTNTFYYDQPYYTDAPDPQVRRVTVAELEQAVHAMRRKPDTESSGQLTRLQLTERLSDTELASLSAQLAGSESRETLQALADASAFFDPPLADLFRDPPPDMTEQQRILAATSVYLEQTIPKLPDYFAVRTAVQYGETPASVRGDIRTAAEPLHVTERSQATVLYRQGAEELENDNGTHDRHRQTLVTYGTFGPLLRAVRDALALPGAVTWSRWERGATTNLAVFRIAVPSTQSRYNVVGCCLPDRDGKVGFATLPGYQGEIAVDPASGAILRIEIIADLQGFVPARQVNMMVTYGPVDIGGKTSILPLRSVNIVRERTVLQPAEWQETFRTWGPYATTINDFTFTAYHMFRGSSRIIPAVPDDPRTEPQ
jgi:VWFA-related protein